MDQNVNRVEIEEVAIRFCGDSGDGMQLTGTLFSDTSALVGNGVSTFPDYPAEIRAPQGTVSGVSGFQVNLGSVKIYTPGDYCDVLVAMNPAALKANAKWVKKGGSIILDLDTFNEKGIVRAGFKTLDPVEEMKLADYHILFSPITTLTKESLKDSEMDNKSILRCKNMFALGMVFYMFDRPMEHTVAYFDKKFGKKPNVAAANKKVLADGYNYAANIQAMPSRYSVAPAPQEKGIYRNINGNTAVAWGLIAASEKSGLPLFCGSYPITPATEILIELAKRKDLGVKTLQAEDEIAGICTSIGASFAGNLAVTTTSGPGLSLKSEALGLAVMTELPLVVVNVQRGGPSTGLPTKTEQSDLNQALWGRNGECPMVVVAASTPSNCFDYAFMSAKISVEHMTPVMLLTDGFIANGSQPWKVPSMKDFPSIKAPVVSEGTVGFTPYKRNPDTLARYWALPGTKGLEHRLGGLEKQDVTGSVSQDPINHELMVKIRDEKVQRIANYLPKQELVGDKTGDLLVIGWGGTYGHLISAVSKLRAQGKKVSLCHIHYINPLPKNLAELLKGFKDLVVCELNSGQLANYLMMTHPDFKYRQMNKVQGLPFTVVELTEKFNHILEGK